MFCTKLLTVSFLASTTVFAAVCFAGIAAAHEPPSFELPQIQIPDIQIPDPPPNFHTELDQQFENIIHDQTITIMALPDPVPIKTAELVRSEKVEPGIERLYIAAAPSTSEQVANLRRNAATELAWIQYLGFNISFQGVMAWLGAGDAPATEESMREARDHMRRYYGYLEQIEALTGDAARALRDYQARVNNMNVDGNGHYGVHTSDHTANGLSAYPSHRDPSSSQAPGGTHEEYEYHIVRGLVRSAGFDSKGNPNYTMGYDVIKTTKQVRNNK